MSRWAFLCGVVLFGLLVSRQTLPLSAALADSADPPKLEDSTIAALRAVPRSSAELPADPATKLAEEFRMIRKVLREECRIDVDFTINFAAFEEVGLNEEKLLDMSPVADRPLEKGTR